MKGVDEVESMLLRDSISQASWRYCSGGKAGASVGDAKHCLVRGTECKADRRKLQQISAMKVGILC